MKKTFYFLGILGLLSILPAQAYQTLSSVEVFRYSQKSFVLSDNFTSYESCVSTKKENDSKYLNYKRSECFSDGKGFKYFICDGTSNCLLTKEALPNEVNQVKTIESPTPGTLASVTISAKNKAQLDIYLQKLEKQKSKYKNVEDYIKQLEKTSAQLGKLSAKYEKNSQVKAMLDYLDQGVKKIITTTKVSSEPVDDVAQLLCELEENCEERQVVIEDGKLEPLPPPTPVVRPGKIQTGTTTTPSPTPTPVPVPPVVGGDSPIVQGMYRLTTKKYVGNFRQHGDVCSKEFGTEWRVADKSRDAFLMAAKNETVWDTLPRAYCEGYSTIASNHFGGTYSFTNGKEVTSFGLGCGGPQYKVVCEKTGTATTPAPTPTPVPPVVGGDNPIVQGIYRLTQKNYKGDFMKSADVCATEFGNEWSVSKETIDAHIMTTKTQKAWLNVNTSACSNYSSHVGETGMSYLNNVTTKNVGCNNEMKVACIKQPAKKQENYQDLLTPATKSQRDDFMKQIDSELSSKIRSDNDFVYLNNYLAISKQEFTGIQLYKDPTVQACPTGYSLAEYEYDGKNNHIASPYTIQILGQYLSNNPNAYSFLELKEAGNQHAHDYRFWRKQSGWDDNFMQKFDEQKIIADQKNLSVFQVRMQNAYLNWRKPMTDTTYYIDNVYGTLESVVEKRPTLCQKTGVKDDFSLIPGNMKKIDGEIIMNQGSSEADTYIMYAYQRIIAEYNGGGDDLYQYFLPIAKEKGYSFYRKSKE